MDKETRYFWIAGKILYVLIGEIIVTVMIKAYIRLITLLNVASVESAEILIKRFVIAILLSGAAFLGFLFAGFYERYRK